MSVIYEWVYIGFCFALGAACLFQLGKGMFIPYHWYFGGWKTFVISLGLFLLCYVGGSLWLAGSILGGMKTIVAVLLSSFADLHGLPLGARWMQITVYDLAFSLLFLLAVWISETLDEGELSLDGFRTALPFSIVLFSIAFLVNTAACIAAII